MAPPDQSPIFIVGAPRSGTTLLATVLAGHSHISCGPETHFCPYLAANYQRIPVILRDATWPEQATQFMAALSLGEYRVHDLYGIDVDIIYDYLTTRAPSPQALLESLTVPQMVATGKTRWAEKTPNHLLHLETLRRMYPQARVIRIVRDPRDAATSMANKLPWASDSPLDNAYLIDSWYRKSQPFFDQDDLTFTVQYEALVQHPESSLKKLCDFVQIPFQAPMLDTSGAAQQTVPHHETWKQQVGHKLDPSRCLVWQQKKSNPKRSRELKAISQVCRKMIQGFGYPQWESSFRPLYGHHISYRFVRSHHQEILRLLDQDCLLTPRSPESLNPRESVMICDVPIEGQNYPKSRKKFVSFCTELLALKLKGAIVNFSPDIQTPHPDRNGFGMIAAMLLRILGAKAALNNLK